ncbi:hypothetical protein [Ktedonobacter racemifer]|uniref:Uncharacterized protein n=1 Tax=Ktedonobacter racemifer DSM 44963 TaxID=485913 RepID=D6TX07_KTERA|nr:hypothetical protein [Ktedonobacter racemifer]EFH84740.1 hypothetical protein Krac_5843 [Ktedonobacter racemifer DSM 44963]
MDEGNTTLRVEARTIGKRQSGDAPWQVTISPDMLRTDADTGQGYLLRNVIASLVRAEVQAFSTAPSFFVIREENAAH